MPNTLAGQRSTLLLLTSVELLVFLDSSVVNLAMPSIGKALGMSVATLVWVSSAYQVTFGGFQLGAGRTTDRLGMRLMFQTGLAVFTAASLLAGLTHTGWALIAARALQGVGAAILIPAELALITAVFTEPEAYRRAFGVWSAMGAVGAAGGVAVGGVIVSALGWQWVFLVNVPIGVLGLLAGSRLLPRDGIDLRAVRRGELDLPGMVTGTGCLLLAVYVATKGAEGSLDLRHWLLAGLAVLLGAAFVLAERRAATPVLPFRLFRTRDITGSALANFLVGAAHVPVFVFLSLYFQEVHHYSAVRSGLAVLPIAVAGIPVARLLIPRALRAVGPRRVLAGGMALLTVALLLLSRIPAHADYAADFLPAAFVFAVGLPACFVGATMPAMRAAAPDETGIVSGLVNTAQRLGAGLGVAVLAAVATSRTAHHGGAPADAVNAGFHLAFLGAAGVAALGLLVALASLREPPRAPSPATATPHAAPAPTD
ncbi:MFS transporter [Streptomyces cocklensis]|uniref:Drug resistance transporter, EmrB/QacA subfamily n=1 Tax=Actinacidiphila cocklensis TaxID=887465 RepID=A0A9W4DVW0_9ACTN|nr:MFS transporter [Actinacidiphila cocklensis]MDD1059466.1 MFS transporter [Actinacidiphila cocklensis]WSX76241.1 MFS transporter [Streptomyces sp. NBC_00899]CAG6397327.1 Drug resistance transporter, EmrB/QacA subfamily [Actinacidiphila cocklensis]